ARTELQRARPAVVDLVVEIELRRPLPAVAGLDVIHRRAPERVVGIGVARVAGLEVVRAVAARGRNGAGRSRRIDVVHRHEGVYGRVVALQLDVRVLEGRAPDAVVVVVDRRADVLQIELRAPAVVDVPLEVERYVLGDVLLEDAAIDVVALQAVDRRAVRGVEARDLVRPPAERGADEAVGEHARGSDAEGGAWHRIGV